MPRNKSFLVCISFVILLWIPQFFSFSCKKIPSDQVERIFLNGHVLTMDGDMPQVEAMAIGEGKFLDVGYSAKMRQKYPDADVYDLEGKTVMPGIIESHGHQIGVHVHGLELHWERKKT
jgi:predicted amidohydrolase YtcJ